MIAKIERMDGITLITPKVFKDHRGEYIELFNHMESIDLFPVPEIVMSSIQPTVPRFLQDDISISHKKVLRGFHGDTKTWKLISCLHGKLYVVIVNYEKDSPNFLQHYTFILDDLTHKMILVPPNHGLAHLVMSNKAIFWYKQTTYYSGAENQFTLRWDDPKLGVVWPIADPILSERDAKAPFL